METQQFCLKWNSHQANMLTVFEQLLSTEALVDVTLACDGLNVKAHKVVLSACSPYFQSLFVDNPCKHPIVIMQDMRFNDLRAIIDFMYRGEVNVSHDQLNALLKTAETLKVKGLAEMSGESRSGLVQPRTSSSPTPTSLSIPQTRSDSPPLLSKRKHGRPRKRFRSGSVHSDDDVVPAKIKEPESPEIEELPQEPPAHESLLSPDIPSSKQTLRSSVNNSHLSRKSQSRSIVEEAPSETEFSVEPSKLMEQTLTTTPVISNGLSSISSSSAINVNTSITSSIIPSGLSIVPTTECQLSITTDSHSSNQTQGPDSPQDVKPILGLEETLIGVDHSQDGSSFMDSSGVPAIAGTSYEDQTALVPQDSQTQGYFRDETTNLYICCQCSHSTRQRVNMQCHIRKHTGERPFKCTICGRTFTQKHSLKTHINRHIGEKPFKCKFCRYESSDRSNLRSHLMAKHQVEYSKLNSLTG